MKQSMRWIFMIMLLCTAVALACGGSGNGSEESTANTVPAATATTTDSSDSAAIGGETLSVEQITTLRNNFTNLNSYHLSLTASFTGTNADGVIESGMITADILNQTQPEAISANLSVTTNNQPEAMAMNFVQLDEVIYTTIAGLGCMSGGVDMMGEVTEPIADFTNPDEGFLQDIESARYVGEQTHNGYLSDCYEFAETDAPGIFDGAEKVEGLLCIAKEYGYLSYLQVHAEGAAFDMFSEEGGDSRGEVTAELSLSEVNEPVEIAIPEGCNATGESPWPILEGARDMVEFAGLVGYSTDLGLDEIVQFYEEEMVALGFEVNEEHDLSEDSATLNYTNGEQTVIISIFAATTGQGWQVLISPEG